MHAENELLIKKDNGSYWVDGHIPIRELNRITGWNFPADGPKTLSGLMVEYVEAIPSVGMTLEISEYVLTVMRVRGNVVQQICIRPKFMGKPSADKIAGEGR